MNFNIKCIGKLSGPTNEFERSLVFETGEFERPKFDCMSSFFTISAICPTLVTCTMSSLLSVLYALLLLPALCLHNYQCYKPFSSYLHYVFLHYYQCYMPYSCYLHYVFITISAISPSLLTCTMSSFITISAICPTLVTCTMSS